MRRIAAILAFSLALASLADRAQASTPAILVDGFAVQTDVPPIVDGGHVLVPLRGVFERFGADVEYDAADNAAIARRGDAVVKVVVGSTTALVDGKPVGLDAPAREIAGRVEVPLRFVAQALGVAVDYDASSNTVVIVSGQQSGNFVAAGPGTPPFAPAPVAQAAGGSPPSVDGQQPSPNSLIGTDYPQIYARLGGGSAPVDPATVRVVVDGIDVTDESTVSSAYVAYTPSEQMTGGTHNVDVSGQSDDGTPFDSQWTFRIESDMTSDYVSSVVGYGIPSFGYPGFGYFPPGFSVFAPGPQYFVFGQPIVLVFFSPFFPSGNGFFSLTGVPGEFGMTPWLGCPGFFWSSFDVPQGVLAPTSVIAAHFMTSDGRSVIVHATAPLHIDGTRKTLPSTLRYAVRAELVNRPLTPRAMVAYARIERSTTIAHRTAGAEWHSMPIVRRGTQLTVQRAMLPGRPAALPAPAPRPIMRPVVPAAPPPMVIPRMPPPAPPVVIPHKSPA